MRDKPWPLVQGRFSLKRGAGGLGGGRGLVLALAAGVYVLIDADDPLLRLLRAQVVMNVLHSFFFFFFPVDMASCTTGENSQLVPRGGRRRDNMKRGLNSRRQDGCCTGQSLFSLLCRICAWQISQCSPSEKINS